MLRKFVAVVQVYTAECFIYPAHSVIWILSDCVAALVLPAVWIAAAGSGEIAGFTPKEMVSYYLVSMTLAQFITCHLMWDIALDIREGFFSAQIVRPFPFIVHCAARNVAWRFAKLILFLPIGAAFYFAYLGLSGPSPLSFSPAFFAALLLGHALSFLAAYTVALVTLWTVESFNILEIYYVPELILSGRFIPLATLPAWALGIGNVLYFRYTVAFPTEMLLGKLNGAQILQGFAVQLLWIAAFAVMARLTLRAGMRRYAGMGL